jgi:predicted NAD-dependent protein-ADP-ribosyltransferase YbiA (DUF1768 family)
MKLVHNNAIQTSDQFSAFTGEIVIEIDGKEWQTIEHALYKAITSKDSDYFEIERLVLVDIAMKSIRENLFNK